MNKKQKSAHYIIAAVASLLLIIFETALYLKFGEIRLTMPGKLRTISISAVPIILLISFLTDIIVSGILKKK
ncbi:MAG: hypothetical protein ACTTK5_03330 [Candidatus Fimenecus sp.]